MTFADALDVLRAYRMGSVQPWPRIRDAIEIVLERHATTRAPQKFSSCPFCGSAKEPIVKEADETFEPRYGCGDCDRWWGPAILKRR